MKKYQIGKYEDLGIFSCKEKMKDGITVLVGTFEKRPSDIFEFIKDNNNIEL